MGPVSNKNVVNALGGPPYGDLTSLNTERTLLDTIGKDTLRRVADLYLNLIGQSGAIYEKNGDYALGIFSSGWCQVLDAASRKLCATDDNRAALASGRWLCHESCWTECSKVSIETGGPVDIECKGGIRLYGVPIRAGGEAIGSINIGYGDPPRDPAKLREIAERYGLGLDQLVAQANAYESRPQSTIEFAKILLHTAAELFGEIVEHKRAAESLREQLNEIDRFNKLMVGRELKMEELRKEIQRLQARVQELEQPEAGTGHEQ